MRQDRSKVRWEEWGWALGTVDHGRFLSRAGQGQRRWGLRRFQKTTLSAHVPHRAGVILTFPLGNKPGSFTCLRPDMRFPVRRWQEVPWWERVILYTLSPGGSGSPLASWYVCMVPRVPSICWAGCGGSRVVET